MSLLPYSLMHGISPADRYFDRFFNEAMHRELRHLERPYWVGHQNPHTFANAVGNVQDDKDKFTVSVDVSHFKPNELKVTTKGHELLIEGHHEEKTDEHGQIERHFVRKYVLPKEAQLDAVVSHLSRDGQLTVSAPKSAIEGPSMRNVAIQPAPEQQRKAVEGNK